MHTAAIIAITIGATSVSIRVLQIVEAAIKANKEIKLAKIRADLQKGA